MYSYGKHKERYEWYKAHGICVKCGQRSAERGRLLCLECWGKQLEANRKRVLSDADKAKMREYMRVKREEWRKNGICTICGKRNANEGKNTCGICRAKDRERHREKAREIGKIPMEERGYGYCFQCCTPIPIDSKRKKCDRCRENDRIVLEENRKKIDYTVHPFRAMNKITFGGAT